MQKATPLQWSKYATANLAMKALKKQAPFYKHKKLQQTLYVARRKTLIGRLYNNVVRKSGKQYLENRL